MPSRLKRRTSGSSRWGTLTSAPSARGNVPNQEALAVRGHAGNDLAVRTEFEASDREAIVDRSTLLPRVQVPELSERRVRTGGLNRGDCSIGRDTDRLNVVADVNDVLRRVKLMVEVAPLPVAMFFRGGEERARADAVLCNCMALPAASMLAR